MTNEIKSDPKADKKAKIAALVKKYEGKLELSLKGPLEYDKTKEDPDYHYFQPLAEQQRAYEAIGYEVVTDPDLKMGENSINRPTTVGNAQEVQFRSAHHVLMRTPKELYEKYKSNVKKANQANDDRLKVNPAKNGTTVTYTKTPSDKQF